MPAGDRSDQGKTVTRSPVTLDAYAEYSTWYAAHYGYPFPVTRDQWNQWCRAPHRRAELMDFDLTCEQREGWAYD